MAQSYAQIGYGTGSNNNIGPFNNFYEDGRHQFTYSASELATAGLSSSDTISSIGWDVVYETPSWNCCEWMNNVEIKITQNGTTTTVYTGNHRPLEGWFDLPISNYTYLGGDLMVEYCYDNSSAPTPAYAYKLRYTYSSTSQVAYNRGDYSLGGCNMSIVAVEGKKANIRFGSPFSGCTDASALNYDPAATADDGSCLAACPNPLIVEFTTLDYMGNGSWGQNNTLFTASAYFTYNAIPSTGNPVTIVFDAGAMEDEYDEIYVFDENGTILNSAPYYDVSGQTFSSNGSINIEFDSDVSINSTLNWTVYCLVVNGCNDPTATNYDPVATADDGSCCFLDNVTLTLYDSFGEGWSANSLTINGDNYALPDINGNYNTSNVWSTFPGGTGPVTFNLCLDLSTCIDVVYNPTGAWQSENTWTITEANGTILNSGQGNSSGSSITIGDCFVDVLGCIDPIALNYNAAATLDDGSCTYCVDGCMDVTQFNYDANATCDDGSCIPFTYGCIDATADNYDASANTDDGSCIYFGCTDATACNYDPIATNDDGNCILLDSLVALPNPACIGDIVMLTAYPASPMYEYIFMYNDGNGWAGNNISPWGLNNPVSHIIPITQQTQFRVKLRSLIDNSCVTNWETITVPLTIIPTSGPIWHN